MGYWEGRDELVWFDEIDEFVKVRGRLSWKKMEGVLELARCSQSESLSMTSSNLIRKTTKFASFVSMSQRFAQCACEHFELLFV